MPFKSKEGGWLQGKKKIHPTPKTKIHSGLWVGKLQIGSHFHQVGYKSNLYYLLLCCFNRLLKTAQRSVDSCTKSLSFSPHITFASWIFFPFLSSWVKFYWSSLENGSRMKTSFMIGKQNTTTPKPQNCEQGANVCNLYTYTLYFICGYVYQTSRGEV